MGNWHCVPARCAEVVYQEYLPPKIRWRYGTEPWQEIIGADNYSTKVQPSYIRDTYYYYIYRRPIGVASNSLVWSTDTIWAGSIKFNGIQSWRLRIIHKQRTFYTPNNKYDTTVRDAGGNIDSAPIPDRRADFWLEVVSQGVTTSYYRGSDTGQWGQGFVAVDGLPIPTTCTFEVFKKGQVIYTETRSVCPEVEKIPCHLNPQSKQIEIDKFPYLERVEVIPWGYENLGANVYRRNIPSNCLNIYKNTTPTIIPLPGGIPTPSNSSIDQDFNYGFVTQICSYPGCPPPEYDVLCDSCGCESCPDGTCAIECHGHICCYNNDGVSVKEIPLADYCGRQT